MEDEENDDESELGWGENVVGLADRKNGKPSNLDYCVEFYKEKAKMLPLTFQLCPKMMNWCVARPRLWILLFALRRIQGMSEHYIEEMATDVMSKVMGASYPVELEDLMLPDDDELFFDMNLFNEIMNDDKINPSRALAKHEIE
eukprot:11606761-Karenia_brevis.AAC.1